MKNKVAVALKIIMALMLPFVISALYCLIRGTRLTDLYLPASYNNDCVFYYKLVDAIVAKGGPTGFFGFNESHAIIGGFAAWSPFLLIPWALWGVIYGWTYYSVILCNLSLFGVALAIFVYLADVDYKALGLIFAMLLLFPSFSIHLMNVLPEIVVASATLIYIGFAVRAAQKGPRTLYIFAMYFLAIYLTLTRPYMVLFMIIPSYYLGVKKKKIIAVLCFTAISGMALLGNYVIGHYYTSAYFEPLYKTDLVKELFTGDISKRYWVVADVFKSMAKGIGVAVIDAFSYGLTMGTQYVIAIVTAVGSLVIVLFNRENKYRTLCLFHFFSVVAMMFAIVFILRKANEGGRHIWTFAIIGIVIVCSCGFDKIGIILKTSLMALLIIFCIRGAIVPTDYDIPMPNRQVKEDVEYWEKIFKDETVFIPTAEGFDNTVIWTLYDTVNEKGVPTEYSELYALPPGMGISCCYPGYVMGNFDNLQSRFIVAHPNGEVSAFCAEKGLDVVGEHGNVVIYRRY